MHVCAHEGGACSSVPCAYLGVAVEGALEDGRRERALALLGEDHPERVRRLQRERVVRAHRILEAAHRAAVELARLADGRLLGERQTRTCHACEREEPVHMAHVHFARGGGCSGGDGHVMIRIYGAPV